MRFLRFLILLCVVVVSGNVFSQSQRELGQLMRERNEYYFTLNVNQPTDIQAINQLCSVDGTDGRSVVCYANQQQYDRLLQAGYQPVLQTPPSLLEEAKMWEGGDRATYEWDSYPTYSQYESMMLAFPESVVSNRTCTYMELGTLSSGRKIMGVRINNGITEGKPKFLYSSTIHGDETTGWILMLRLIDELCTSNDQRIVNLVNNLDIFIFPNANPDGTYYRGDNNVTGARRYNANGVDMNRNYPDPHGSEHPDSEEYQTETQWFMQLAEQYPFVMAANYHGGSEVMNYPWDNTYTLHADDAWWQYVSREYANLCQSVNSSYMTDENNGITNGAQWYTIGGGRQDYMNGYRQCREITIECSTIKNPSASQLPDFWNYNHNAMLTYMEECLNGVHGYVYDALTNEPLDGVTITVLNHDDEYSIVSSHEAGDFHRPIKGGTYTFEFKKNGYCTETRDVTIADGQRVDLTVNLGQCEVQMNCYNPVTSIAAGSYIMGHIDGTNLYMPGQSSSTVNTTSVVVEPNDNGFSVEEGTTLPQVTLTAYGDNGQYYISYNNRYLAKSSYGSSLTWSNSSSSSARWYINEDGIYVAASSSGRGGGSTTNYYLHYDNGFKLSTIAQDNNINFYALGDCPESGFTITATANPAGSGIIEGAGTYNPGDVCTLTATANEGYTFINWTERGEEVSSESSFSFEVTSNRSLEANFEEVITTVTQNSILQAGWNWWTPGVDMDGAAMLTQLKQGLGANGVTILAQSGSSCTYSSHGWSGTLSSLEVGTMYMIKVASNCSVTFEGSAIDAAQSITLVPGNNWIGFFGSQATPVNTALANHTPTIDDVITAQDGKFTTYSSHGWGGTLQNLVPGEAYIYNSKASSEQTFTYQLAK